MTLLEKGIVVSSYTDFIYTNRSELLLNFDLFDGHPPVILSLMKFIFIRPKVCHLFPSDFNLYPLDIPPLSEFIKDFQIANIYRKGEAFLLLLFYKYYLFT